MAKIFDTLYHYICLYDDTALQTAAYPSLEPLPLTTYLSATVIVLMMSSWADSWVWRREEGKMANVRWFWKLRLLCKLKYAIFVLLVQ